MIEVLNHTNLPLTFMGQCASECWGSKPSKRIGLECVQNNHGRVLEFADITIKITGYSSRMIRELYTSIIGVTRLQSSTRYIDERMFDYHVPESMTKSIQVLAKYHWLMKEIQRSYDWFLSMGVPKEDVANILPLAYESTVILKINARALRTLFETRTCSRTYVEYRDFMKELKTTLQFLDAEWNEFSEYLVTKCEVLGYCPERYSCGRYPKKE